MSCYINRMFLFAFFFGGIISTALSQKTPIAGLSNQITAKSDWLVTPINQKAQVIEDGDNGYVEEEQGKGASAKRTHGSAEPR